MKIKLLIAMLMAFSLTSFAENTVISVETDNTALVYVVGDNGRLYQSYLGKRLSNASEYGLLPQINEAYMTHGMEDYYEPALHINRVASPNSSSLLKYVAHEQKKGNGYSETIITLADPEFADVVKLHIAAYGKENVFKYWTEITNNEKKAVELEKFASSMLHFNASEYYLTQFSGDWINENNIYTQQLFFGKKVLDTKLGARESMFLAPYFQLSIGEPATETTGIVLSGTLAWMGNYRHTFEVDHAGKLRVISGINPYFSRYPLEKGETFTTPEFIFTYSEQGTGYASRNMHDWARRYQIKDGMGDRMTLLNNWEATYFDFNEDKLLQLIGEAKELGVDMFLLDDGWFGNKHPRHSDTQGLGDWDETANKLPNGIGRLTAEAKKQGIKFGLWIEPEMVNPKSELYEKHKDWVITLPNRDEYYFRNQLVLDLSNPAVQDHVFGVVDKLMTKYPDIAYFKWDCNSPITNIYSVYQGKNQMKLYIDYALGLKKVLDRVAEKYPNLPMMLCSGGGGRVDYDGLRYFPEMWPSDNTDPIQRLYIQYGYSQMFPAKVQCAHVTTWNKKASIKFRTNVAMMGKLGFDLNLHDLSDGDLAYVKRTIKEYNSLKPVILDGDQYQLVSPYSGNHSSTMYVDKSRNRAVVFQFDIHPLVSEKYHNVKLQGLDAEATYKVAEINRYDGSVDEGKTYSGDYLMTVGLPLFTGNDLYSRVFEIKRL